MLKTLIPIIAKELNIKIGEVFEIEGDVGRYRFTTDDLEWLDDSCSNPEWEIAEAAGSIVWDMLKGYSVIIKQPFKPSRGQAYWTYSDYWQPILEYKWSGLACELMALKTGCIFRTEDEALAARSVKFKELTGKDWSNM